MNSEDNKKVLDLLSMLVDENKELQDRIDKALDLLDSYKLGKYDYALTPAVLLEFEDTLKGKTLQDYYDEEFSIEDIPKEESIKRLMNTIKTHIPKPPKEDRNIEKLNEHYYHDEPALIEDMAHKINKIIDKINGDE